jgi:hypothetical protein
MAIALTIVAILIIGAIVGSTLNFAGIFLGIPIALIVIGVVVMREGFDRQSRILRMKRFRRDARARKVEFTEADERTLV